MLKYILIIVIWAGSICSSFAQQKEAVVPQDSLYLQRALDILDSYTKNDSLKQALQVLEQNIKQDKTQKAIEVLKNASGQSLEKIGGKEKIDSLLQLLKSDAYFTWFSDLAKDSITFNIYDVLGNQTKICTNSKEMSSQRYWLYKSETDSLGFWLHTLPEDGILLVPDFDIYQESAQNTEKNALMLPIPIKENPEAYNLIPFMKYRRILQPWESGVVTNIDFSQSHFQNWVKGGENSVAIRSDIRAFLNYKKYNTEWENDLRWKYGIIQSDKIADIVRNEDLLEFNSKLGLKASKKWFYSMQLNMKTQLFNGYVYKDEKEQRISDFLSPGYLSLALGMDYKPSKKFSLLLSAVTGRLTYMHDIEELDETTYGIEEGEKLWGQLGPYMAIKWKDKLFSSVHFDTSLELFSNYFNNPENIDVDWNTIIDMRINYFMTTRLSFQLLYDDDVQVPLYEKVNGVKQARGTGKRVQFNENFSIGLIFVL